MSEDLLKKILVKVIDVEIYMKKQLVTHEEFLAIKNELIAYSLKLITSK